MQLIGMLDSPYVRRTAISLHVMGLPFEHCALSVFSTFDQFLAVNPVVKAPSLVCDDGEVLMDSTLILEYADALVPGRSLLPAAAHERQHALRVLGLALAGCEKSVQIYYERNLRPAEKQHAPWLQRVTGQLLAAYALLEAELVRRPLQPGASQAAITSAVVWEFTQSVLAAEVPASAHPALQALSDASEVLPAFRAFPPDGPGVPSSA